MATLVTSPNPQAPIIPNVQIETVYYGSAWTGQGVNAAQAAELAAESQDLDQFFGAITKSHYMDLLSQYFMTNPQGTIIRPGYGSFVRHDFVSANLTSGSIVSDATLEAMLSKEIQGGALDAPNGNTLYMVFMPPGVLEQGDVGSGGGHHSSFAYGGGTAYYATIDHPSTGLQPLGSVGSETNFQTLTEVASHEMVEAITDPMGNVPSQAAWYDRSTGNEIGDITNNNPPPGGVMGLLGTNGFGYVVQKYWSNQDNTSKIPGGISFQNISIVPDLANFTFGLTDSLGHTELGNWGNPIANDGSHATFVGTFDGQEVTIDITANDGQKLDVTITSVGGSKLFSGTISQPSGSWTNETQTGDFLAPAYVELAGTLYVPWEKSRQAFGTGGAITPPQFTGADYGGSYGGMGDGPNGMFNNYNSPNRFHHPAYE
jgi:hypothetical protein